MAVSFITSMGMKCFVRGSKAGGKIFGRIKDRPRDFIVNEIDQAGNVVTLNQSSVLPTVPHKVISTTSISSTHKDSANSAQRDSISSTHRDCISSTHRDCISSAHRDYISSTHKDSVSSTHYEDSVYGYVDKPAVTGTLISNDSVLKYPTEGCTHGLISSPVRNMKDTSPVTTPTSIPNQDLSSLISSELLLSLNELNHRFKVATNNSTEILTTAISLGVIDDRTRRTNIHSAIKREFPLLNSTTSRGKGTLSHDFMSQEECDMPYGSVCVMPDPHYFGLSELLGSDEAESLLRFIKMRNKEETHCLPMDPCKDHRKEVHRFIKNNFGKFLESKSLSEFNQPQKKRRRMDKNVQSAMPQDTEPSIEPKQICVRFRKMKRAKGKSDDESSKSAMWLKCALKKVSISAFEVVKILSQSLSCHPSAITMAGLKDSKAITTQLITLKNIQAERVAGLAHPQLEFGNYEYVSNPLELGDLSGNRFELRIVDVRCDGNKTSKDEIEGVVKELLGSITTNGFINYFGPQRFGKTRSTVSFDTAAASVAVALLRKDPVKAIDYILEPLEQETEPADGLDREKAKWYYAKTGDIKGTLDRMPENFTREIYVLKALDRFGKSVQGCRHVFMSIPVSMRTMYLHLFTSLVWNHLASFRISKYGTQPVKGDLVLIDTATPIKTSNVKYISEEDIESNKYSIFDVVLPVIGKRSILPENDVKLKLNEMLSEVNVSLSDFDHLHQYGLYSISGTYRRLMAKPEDMSWTLCDHHREEEERKHDNDCKGEDEEPLQRSSGMEWAQSDTSTRLSLELKFSLKPAIYATSMLRELLENI